MKELAEYTSDEKEKGMLLSMATTTPEGKELYKNWVQDSCRHIASILEDMPSCKPPIGMAMDHACHFSMGHVVHTCLGDSLFTMALIHTVGFSGFSTTTITNIRWMPATFSSHLYLLGNL